MSHVNIRIRDDEDLDPKERRKREIKYRSPYSNDMQRREEFLDVEMQKRRWKNRRRMAWISLIGMNILTLVLLFAPIADSRLKVISEPIIWSYFAFASVIGAYMGFTTWATRK